MYNKLKRAPNRVNPNKRELIPSEARTKLRAGTKAKGRLHLQQITKGTIRRAIKRARNQRGSS